MNIFLLYKFKIQFENTVNYLIVPGMHHHQQQENNQLYQNIISIYRQQSYHTHQPVTYMTTVRIFNEQSQKILEDDFKKELLDEIWEHIDSGTDHQKQVISIAEGFVEAYRILQSRIDNIESETGILKDRKLVLSDKYKEIENYRSQSKDYYIKRTTILESQCEKLEQEIKQIQLSYANFKQQLNFINAILVYNQKINDIELVNSRVRSVKEHRNQLIRSYSKSLTFILYASCLGLALQYLMMCLGFRKSFMAIVCNCISLQILFIGFIKYRIAFYLIFGIGFSIILDILLLILRVVCQRWIDWLISSNLLSQMMLCPQEGNQGVVQYGLMGILIISLLLRIMMGVYWLKHATITKKQYYFKVMGQKFDLNKRVIIDQAYRK